MALLNHVSYNHENVKVFGGHVGYTLGTGSVQAFYSNHTFNCQMHAVATSGGTNNGVFMHRMIVSYGGPQIDTNLYTKFGTNVTSGTFTYNNSGGSPTYNVGISLGGTGATNLGYTCRGMFNGQGGVPAGVNSL